jgi:hypothetical protein
MIFIPSPMAEPTVYCFDWTGASQITGSQNPFDCGRLRETLMTLEQLCWLATLAYGIHIVEEYLLDWRSWVRWVSGVEITSGFFWGMNGLVLVLGAVCAAVADRFPMLALAYPALMLINATFFHVSAMVLSGRFSPGLITAVLIFYPFGLWCFRNAQADGVLTASVFVGAFGLGAIFMAVPIVLIRAREARRSRRYF